MKRTSLLLASLLVLAPLLPAQQTEPTSAQTAQSMVQRYAMTLGLSSTQQEQALVIFFIYEIS